MIGKGFLGSAFVQCPHMSVKPVCNSLHSRAAAISSRCIFAKGEPEVEAPPVIGGSASKQTFVQIL